MLSLLRSPAIWALALLPLATSGRAATLLAEGYSIRVWQSEDGLPQNAVTSAVQTSDGYLWVGTFGGVARFDGEQFRVFNSANTPELQDSRVVSLFEDADGSLWIGHETGAITRYRAGRFEPMARPTGTIRPNANAIGSDEHGRIWVLRNDGALESLTDDIQLPSPAPPGSTGVIVWTRNHRGNIRVAVNGLAARLLDGQLIPLAFDEPAPAPVTRCVASAADGGLWVLQGERVRKWSNEQWTEEHAVPPRVAGNALSLLELRDGTLAVAAEGLYLIFRDGRAAVHFDRSNGLLQNWVRFLYEDREGNLWMGVGSAGLAKVYPTAFSVLNPPDQWQGHTVLSVAPGRDETLWIGTEGAGLYRFAAGEWTRYGEAAGLGNPFIWAVHESAEGKAWVGTWTGGLYRHEDGRFVRPPHLDEVAGPVFAVTSDPVSGNLLAGTRDGLVQVHDDGIEWLFRSPAGAAANVCAITRDRAGAIWFALAEKGLARLDGGELTTFDRKDGLTGVAVQCLFADPDGSLWIGTSDAGLARYKNGKFATIGMAQGLAHHVVCHIADDDRGHLWLSTHHGIQRVARVELHRCADGLIPAIASQTFDRNDGLPTIEFSVGLQAAGAKSADGRIWFTSSKGLVAVDPKRIQPNPTPPPVALESLLVDGKAVPLVDAAAPSRLPPDHQRLEFRFTGLSFVAPGKVLFKYRLDGLDKAWVEAGARRTASYSQLPDGTYTFRVIACNNDGVWNNDGAAITFTVAPFFWQTAWFLSSAALLVLSAVALLVRHLTHRRMQRRMEAMERQHALERERARIAQDIHDDIGTSLARIAMLSQPARGELAEPQRAAAVLTRIYTTAREVTRALDEIVWAVNPRHDTLDSLVSYVGKFAQDFLGAVNIRCRLDAPVDLPAWPITAETRHNLFLAFKEALNNVLKHAAASEVRISLHLLPGSFVLAVKDNGRGFDPKQRTSPAPDRIISGNGLSNMTRRLASIGGRCEISSVPDQGTSVSFIVGLAGKASPEVPPSRSHSHRPPAQPVT